MNTVKSFSFLQTAFPGFPDSCFKNIISIAIVLVLAAFTSGCATNETIDDTNTIVFGEINKPSAYKINIVNASNNTINDIKYKPCNSHETQYLQLADNLRPMEKFSINIYSQCVDLLATNAFKKKLVDVKNVDLESTKTWTIR